MVRLKDIAQQAGVSIMTVSKAMRDEPDISAETKERIHKLAQQMGYVPNTMAQSLRNRNTRVFGLIVPSTTDPIFARITLAIEESAHEMGYDLMLAFSHNRADREEASLKRLLARHVAGVFLAPVYRLAPKAAIYEELIKRGIPTVILGPRAPFCQSFANVETDDLIASHRMTTHLLKLGHRRIAFFSGPAIAPWAQERLEGYRRALREAGHEVDDRLIFSAGTTIEEGEKAALQFLNEAPNATAVQAVNDFVAAGAASIFLAQGIRVPNDISVAGFGNILLSEHFRVPLTTVRQPKFRLGAAGVDTMKKMLDGGPGSNTRLPAEIVIRQSTSPPANLA